MVISVKDWLKTNLSGDYHIWGIVLFLSVASIAVVYSATGTYAYSTMQATEAYLLKHGALVVVGLVGMWWVHRLNYVNFAHYSRIGMWLSVFLLLYTFLFGVRINGAPRWLAIPLIGATFQPSDLAKLALITNLSAMLAKRQHIRPEEYEPRLLWTMIFWVSVICGLIALTNASTAVLLGATCFLLMYIGRVPGKYLTQMVVFCLIMGAIALFAGSRWPTFFSRLEQYYEVVIKGTGRPSDQAWEANIALANGSVFGQGPGNSQQRNFLPHPYSDFIYAVIVEEYGSLGGIATVLIYLYLLWRGMRAIQNSRRAFGGLLSAGLTFSLVGQAMINMAVAVGLVPVTGQPLPLLSMGGTSMIFTGLSIGLILSVSRGEADESVILSTGQPKANRPA